MDDLVELNTPLHTAKPMPNSERKAIIESYSPMAHLNYRAPAIIPSAERMMNHGQKYEDNALKQLQYLLSAVFRPLDILTNEMFTAEHVNYTLPLDEYQQTLTQQHTAKKTIRDATTPRRQRRFNRNSSNSNSNAGESDSSFFRSGPPSEQGSFFINNNNSSNYNNSNNSNNNHNNFLPKNNSNNKKNTNPFRQ
ncbi:hypothetical protein [Parasitella parasitica]|uniref:Uncharacterized protein n=1 Tax=Parasitella parasitica TaxID=35722 RepID=A0A0B7NCW4_9FUNG|nr:hypothetical protein [Parasitella parasitica]